MTAEEFFKETPPDDKYGLRAKLITTGMKEMIYEIMAMFARLKAQEALEAASDKLVQAPGTFNSDYRSQKISILNAYDINSIV